MKKPSIRSLAAVRKSVLTPASGGLGTFGGVFTPSILTILGVIMYLRLGWVVGNVGLAATWMIVTISTAITFLTGLSIAAIATDQRVRVGGAYYMISRSLGIEVGGAIGIPLYLAQALSVALYTVGFAESVARAFPVLNERAVGIVVTVLVALLALASARVAIRAQYFIMGAIGLSLLSLVLGGGLDPPTGGVVAATSPRESFWPVFAVFFPAVTGIMAGVNLSGDLEDPARSIPRGTFAAIGVGYLVYMSLPFVLAARVDAASLIEDPLVMRRISFWGDAILLGVWGATLSSAVGSILGAPRVLQALARDRVLPKPLRGLGRGSDPDDTPRAGTIVTLGLALAAVALGNLNVIAPILTMFFLTTYGVLNIAAAIERFVKSPSFRPTFSVHWSLSLLGAAGCIAVMLVLNAAATAAAALLVAGVFVWLQRRELRVAWGDARQGLWMTVLRAGLVRVKGTTDAKNWRPHMVVLAGSPMRRWHLIDFANALGHNRALMTVASVVPPAAVETERREAMEERIENYLADRAVQALSRVVPAEDLFHGVERVVATYGLGRLVPNTFLLGATRDPEEIEVYARTIRFLHESRRNVVMLRHDEDRGFGDRRRIDVWWGGLKGNGGLMIILAHLLQTGLAWQGAEIRVRMVVPNAEAVDPVRRNLTEKLQDSRVDAIPEVTASTGIPFERILRESSREADLALLGMAEPRSDFASYYRGLLARTRGLPPTVFVLASEDIGFGELLR